MHGQKNMDTGWVQGELDLSAEVGQVGIPDLHFPEPVKESTPGIPDMHFPEPVKESAPGIPDMHFPEPAEESSLGVPDIVFPAVPEVKEDLLRDAARELPDGMAVGEKSRSGFVQGVLRGLFGRVK